MEQSINDMSKEEAYRRICAPTCYSLVNRSFRIAHLTTERGRTLNGKTCKAVKFTADFSNNPDMRLQCLIEGGEKPILVKGDNLIPVEANVMQSLMQGSSPLSDDVIILGLEQALAQHRGYTDRKDLEHRIHLYRQLLDKLKCAPKNSGSKNALKDEDYCFPCGASFANNGRDFESTFDYIMAKCRPACVGNTQLDVRFMDLGLKGNGTATCTICSEVLDASPDSNRQELLVTLPCVHMFHHSCLCNWLQSDLGRRNWNCPTCRQQVPHNLSRYRVNYEAQLMNRFHEFLLSGYCPKCIIWVMEKDRNQNLPGLINDRGEEVSVGCVGQMQTGGYIFPPS